MSKQGKGPKDGPAEQGGEGGSNGEHPISRPQVPEQTLSDSDQSAADTDQTSAEGDQSASDVDQAQSDADQRSSDRDQAASDRDLGAHPGPAAETAHDDSQAQREQSTTERDAATFMRSEATLERESAAAIRDDMAHLRDEAAGARDRAAEQMDAIRARAPRVGPIEERLDAALEASDAARVAATKERRRAAAERERAATDRERAAKDRLHAAAELGRAHIDALTGAYRREMGEVAILHEIERARRLENPLMLAWVDIDGLKEINDQYGHSAGDDVLRNVALAIRTKLRPYDPLVRMGGDEFVCTFVTRDESAAASRFGEIQALLEGTTERASISFGFAALRDEETLEAFLERGDKALYKAKDTR